MKSETLTFKPVSLPCGEPAWGSFTPQTCLQAAVPIHVSTATHRDSRPTGTATQCQSQTEAVRNIKGGRARLFLSSATDPFHPMVSGLAEELLHRALRAGTFVVISTKALATLGIVKLLSEYRGQVSYTVSLSSLSEERNCILEPKAASARERLHGRHENGEITFCGIEQLARKGIHVTLKADTLFPGIDDAEESITSLLEEAKTGRCGGGHLFICILSEQVQTKARSVPFASRIPLLR